MIAPVTASQRFNTRLTTACPVCGGGADLPPGQGKRCHGYLSRDGRYAHCSREELAGGLTLENGDTYAHLLIGPCRCGKTHGQGPQCRADEAVKAEPGIHASQLRRRIVAIYDYRDESGTVLHQTVRYAPKQFRQRQPDGQGDYTWNLAGVRCVLYRLPELLASDPAAPVLFVEGEKDADRLAALGFVVTTAPMGAKKWQHHYGPWLRGRDVVIIPDNDGIGRSHCQIVGRALQTVALSVRVLQLRDLPDKGDVSDWLDAGGPIDELHRLIAGAPAWSDVESDEIGTETVGAGSGNSWPKREELPPRIPAAPSMPACMVPEPLRDWMVDSANRVRIPLEMLVVGAMVAVGATVGSRIGIRPSLYDEFTTVPNLWGAVVARPGWMKSQAISEPFRPVRRLEAKARDQFEEACRIAGGKEARLNAELKAIQRRMGLAAREEPWKQAGTVESLEILETEFARKKTELASNEVKERRYTTQDSTVEKIGELLRENPRGLALVRDELSGWLLSQSKPGREGDREFYLEAWNGTGSFTVDRIGRGTKHIRPVTLSVFGSIQPGKLKPLLNDAIGEGTGDDGMIQRLQLLVAPDRLPEWERPTDWGDPEAQAGADAVFAALDCMTWEDVRAQAAEIPYLRFSPDAQQIADEWRVILEKRLRSGELDSTPAFASHLAKYRSLMPKLALLFYLIDLAAGAPGIAKGAVGEVHVRLAADWCEFLELHARKIYAQETAPGVAAAHALVAKVEIGAITDGQAVRDICRSQWSGLRTPERVWSGLNELSERGWVRIQARATGANPGQVVRLHPDLLRNTEAQETGNG